ncbi:hypothetical protein C8F01DRAFT_1243033 [Mycena amicta]|nr:hypothetical protein C8F01DRAFT_1243033 [Mycena amicta]
MQQTTQNRRRPARPIWPLYAAASGERSADPPNAPRIGRPIQLPTTSSYFLSPPTGPSSRIALALHVPPVSHISYDVRYPPSTLRNSAPSSSSSVTVGFKFSDLNVPFCPSSTGKRPIAIRVISRDFPWMVDVRGTGVITCQEVLIALYECLQTPLTDTEWGFASDNLRARIVRAWKRRHAAELDNEPLRRVDLLGARCKLQGFCRDEEFARRRILPGRGNRVRDEDAYGVDVWIVKFIK